MGLFKLSNYFPIGQQLHVLFSKALYFSTFLLLNFIHPSVIISLTAQKFHKNYIMNALCKGALKYHITLFWRFHELPPPFVTRLPLLGQSPTPTILTRLSISWQFAWRFDMFRCFLSRFVAFHCVVSCFKLVS